MRRPFPSRRLSWAKLGPPGQFIPAVTLGIEPFPFVATDVILGALGMTDKHQDMFIPEREEIGTGAILVGIGPASIRFIKRMDVFPVDKIGGLKQIGNIAVRLRRRIGLLPQIE